MTQSSLEQTIATSARARLQLTRRRQQLALICTAVSLLLGLVLLDALFALPALLRGLLLLAAMITLAWQLWRYQRDITRRRTELGQQLAEAQQLETALALPGNPLITALWLAAVPTAPAGALKSQLTARALQQATSRLEARDLRATLDLAPIRQLRQRLMLLVGVASLMLWAAPWLVETALPRALWPWSAAPAFRLTHLTLELTPSSPESSTVTLRARARGWWAVDHVELAELEADSSLDQALHGMTRLDEHTWQHTLARPWNPLRLQARSDATYSREVLLVPAVQTPPANEQASPAMASKPPQAANTLSEASEPRAPDRSDASDASNDTNAAQGEQQAAGSAGDSEGDMREVLAQAQSLADAAESLQAELEALRDALAEAEASEPVTGWRSSRASQLASMLQRLSQRCSQSMRTMQGARQDATTQMLGAELQALAADAGKEGEALALASTARGQEAVSTASRTGAMLSRRAQGLRAALASAGSTKGSGGGADHAAATRSRAPAPKPIQGPGSLARGLSTDRSTAGELTPEMLAKVQKAPARYRELVGAYFARLAQDQPGAAKDPAPQQTPER